MIPEHAGTILTKDAISVACFEQFHPVIHNLNCQIRRQSGDLTFPPALLCKAFPFLVADGFRLGFRFGSGNTLDRLWLAGAFMTVARLKEVSEAHSVLTLWKVLRVPACAFVQ